MSVAKKFASNALNDVDDFRKHVTDSTECETELLGYTLAAWDQMAKDTEGLPHAWDALSMPSNELGEVVQLKMSVKDLKENIACLRPLMKV